MAGREAQAKEYVVRQSKKLPVWLRLSIGHSLGIKRRASDTTVIAAILYSMTIISALVLVGTTALHSVAAAVRRHDDVGDAVVKTSLTIFWCLLSLYAKNLAYRLYSSDKFLHMVRLHAKTVLKINSAFVFFLLITSFVLVNNVQEYAVWYADPTTCAQVGMDVIVCQMRFISLSIFSVFAVVWNSLVGIVLLSVCRTNTMGSFHFNYFHLQDGIVIRLNLIVNDRYTPINQRFGERRCRL